MWLGVFALWLLILSGVVNGAPGIVQAVKLRQMLDNKLDEIHVREIEIAGLEQDKQKLQSSHYAQELEIRRVLGYAAAGELVFDFTRAK